MNAPVQKVYGFRFVGLIILKPVYIGKAPKQGSISHPTGLLKVFLAVFSLRRTIKPGELLSHRLFVCIFKVRYFFFESLLIGNCRHVRVMHGMVAYDMTFRLHALYNFRVFFNVVSYQEKCRRHFLFF